MKTKLPKVMCAMTSPLPAGDDGPRLNPSGLTSEPVMLMGMTARVAKMRMHMTWEMHRKQVIDRRRMWRTEGIVGCTWEPVITMGTRARMVTMQMRMGGVKHRQPMMDQHRIWRTVGIAIESVKIGQYISDL